MKEITYIDRRTVKSVHETDRTSADLLAKVYQHLSDRQEAEKTSQDSVQIGVTLTSKPVLMQEAQP